MLAVHHPGYVRRGACWLYYPGIPWWVYTSCTWDTLYHPGYTHHPSGPGLYDEGCGTAGSDEALGSTLGIVRGMRRREVSRLPKV